MGEENTQGLMEKLLARLLFGAVFLSGIIVVAISYEIVMRYVFSSPTLWVYELSWWLSGVIYLLAGVYVMQQKEHIKITVIYDLLPLKLRKTCDIMSFLCISGFSFAVIWGGFDGAYDKLINWERLGSAWNPPIPAIMYPLILVTLTLISWQALINLIKDWQND